MLRRVAWGASVVCAGGVGALLNQIVDDTLSLPKRRLEIDEAEVLEDICPFGFPSSAPDSIVVRRGYVGAYDFRLKNPSWIMQHLTRENVQVGEDVKRDRLMFKEDDSIPESFQSRVSDFSFSGYDRGHLAPARDNSFDHTAMSESFLLTNVSPQVGDGFNRHYWARVEEFVRNLTREYSDVYVATGPLFLPDESNRVSYPVIGDSQVAVPTHFFKIVLAIRESDVALGSFVLPNQSIAPDTPFQKFEWDLYDVERSAGLNFFPMIDNRYDLPRLCESNQCTLGPQKDFAKARAKQRQTRRLRDEKHGPPTPPSRNDEGDGASDES